MRLLPLLLLSGCAAPCMAPHWTSQGIASEGDIRLKWRVVTEQEAKAKCGNHAFGCAEVFPGLTLITISEGVGFEQECKLARLGHEVNHAMGARHDR
jgi:hypothetical protein